MSDGIITQGVWWHKMVRLGHPEDGYSVERHPADPKAPQVLGIFDDVAIAARIADILDNSGLREARGS